MTKELKQKIAWMNFWAKNKNLKPLLFILLVVVMAALHIFGIIVMVR